MTLKELLNGKATEFEIANFISYIDRQKTIKEKDGSLKYPYFQKLSDAKLSELFLKVKQQGLILDGVHITIQSTGISYDYVAYKNKMLLVYPESLIDCQLVYKGDDIKFSKENSKVIYTHLVNDPFNQLDANILGGYCVIRNKRGEFLTTLSKEDIDKHRKIAKTDYIWKAWFKEMCLKTLIKKAVKVHFEDIYTSIEEEDNLQYDLEKINDFTDKINKCTTRKQLEVVWKSMNEKQQEQYADLITQKGKEINGL